MLIVIAVVAGVAYSGFLVYYAFPVEGVDAVTVVSDLEAEGAAHGVALRSLDVVSALLTLVLVPYLWWGLPRGVWRHVAVWGTLVFVVFGVPAGLVPLPCGEDVPRCPAGTAEEVQAMAHNATSIISTTALIFGAGAAALAVRRQGPRWLKWAGWLTVGVQVASGLAFAVGYLAGWDALTGVVQRVEILGIAAWIICLGVYAATEGVRPATREPGTTGGRRGGGSQAPGRARGG